MDNDRETPEGGDEPDGIHPPSGERIDRTTGKRLYLDDAEWAYQNLDRAHVIEIDEAPSAGAWSLLQRARKDPSVLDAPMMLRAKRRQADEEERLIQKDLVRREEEMQAMIDRLLVGATVEQAVRSYDTR
jgi:hypothetical protein